MNIHIRFHRAAVLALALAPLLLGGCKLGQPWGVDREGVAAFYNLAIFHTHEGFSGAYPEKICVEILGPVLWDLALDFNGQQTAALNDPDPDDIMYYVQAPGGLDGGQYRMNMMHSVLFVPPIDTFTVFDYVLHGMGDVALFDRDKPANRAFFGFTPRDIYGNPVPPGQVAPNDFTVQEVRFQQVYPDGTTIPICGLTSGAEVVGVRNRNATSTAIAIDTSGSMSNADVDLAKQAARAFGDTYLNLHPGAEAALYSFDDVTFRHTTFTQSSNTFRNAVNQIPQSRDGTALYDTIRTMLAYVDNNAANSMQYVVAMTDGRDNGDGSSADQVIQDAKNRGITVFTVGLGDDINQDDLERIASATGGLYIHVQIAGDLATVFVQIAEALGGFLDLAVDVQMPQNEDGTPALPLGNYVLTAIVQETYTDATTPTYMPLRAPFAVLEAPIIRRSCKDILDFGESVGDGVYTIDPDGLGGNGNFDVYCDMTTDGGGWTLVLAYDHVGGTNNALTAGIRPQDPAGFSHFSRAQMQQLGTINEMRLYCETDHYGWGPRIHFTTTNAGAINYFRGVSRNRTRYWQSSWSAMPGHAGRIPAQVNSSWNRGGEDRMTAFPFYRSGNYHWGIRGNGDRWECDDYSAREGGTHYQWNTLHNVWVR